MATYEGYPIETDPSALAEDAYAWLQDRWPGWLPDSANFDAGSIEAHARMLAELRDLAANVPDEIFRRYGPLASVPPVFSAYAHVTATLTAINALGYTLQAGTVFGIRAAGDRLVRFVVDSDVTIAPGSSVSAAGAVSLTAEDPGAEANALGAAGQPVELVDRTLPWLASLALTAATSGGATEETLAEYLDRLAGELRLSAPRPILSDDFADFARRHPLVDRAVALNLYQPPAGSGSIPNGVGAGADGVEKAVTVYVVDAAGEDPGATARGEVQADLESRRETGFLVYVGAVAYDAIDVTVVGQRYPQWEAADVAARVKTAVEEWLAPRDWGVSAFSDDRDWVFDDKVRLGELVEVVNRVDGFWRLTGPAANGMPLIEGVAADHTIVGTTGPGVGGRVSLPRAGTVTVTIT